MIHDNERVDRIRRRVETKQDSLRHIESQVTDEGFRKYMGAVNWIDDVETVYLEKLENEDRTPQEEALWLAHTEAFLRIAEAKAEDIEQLFNKYGPGVRNRRMIPGLHL